MYDLTSASTVRINDACQAAAYGGRTVFADLASGAERHRIIQAKRQGGELRVKVLTSADRCWFPAVRVYID